MPREVGEDELGDVSTLLRHRYDPSPPPEASFVFEIVDGPDRNAVPTALDGSHPGRVLVGKGPACDIRIDDPEVSRRHLALEVVGPRLQVTDLRSTNGTTVDGLAIESAFLRGGETIRIGATSLRVQLSSPRTPQALDTTSFGAVVGISREMRRIHPLCTRLAASNVPVILEGETGTGKEVLARALHDASPRRSHPFVVFDCTAVPPSLIESELFGHERGSFTGAAGMRKGVFEQADGGTLLVDEIGDLDLSLQPKFLRALERGEIRRVGGDRWITIDVRILAATRRDLDREVQAGRFRDDLFHRIAVGRIELPPLRHRRGDIAKLAHHFWSELGGGDGAIAPDLLARWEDQAWPGNVRELRNAVSRQLVLGELAELDPPSWRSDAPSPGNEAPSPLGERDVVLDIVARRLPLTDARQLVLAEFERRYVEAMLAHSGGNVTHAAQAAGIPRRYFQLLKARRCTPDASDRSEPELPSGSEGPIQ